MKTSKKSLLLLLALFTSLSLISAGLAAAQTFTTLYSFTTGGYNSVGVFTNSDGNGLLAGLIVSGNKIYGTASEGGTWPGPVR